MADRNLLLVGQAEEIDLLLPEVRLMMSRQGIYLASDTKRPGMTVPLVVTAGELWSINLDAALDPARFKPSVQIAGPFYAPDEEQELVFRLPVLMPACPFCGGPPCPIVARGDHPFGAAPLQDEYGEDGLAVEAYVFCHECGADGPKHQKTIYSRDEYAAAEVEAVRLWCDRTSKNRRLYVAGVPEGLNHYPRPARDTQEHTQ